MLTRPSRACLAMLAVLLLAVPAAGAWQRITTFFFASFDQKGAGNDPPPIAAESGSITVNGPGFSIAPNAEGGGSLVAAGSGADSTLTAMFDKTFNGTEIQITWCVTPGVQMGSICLRAMEDTDGEVIDVGWDGNGDLVVDGTPLEQEVPGNNYYCTLLLRKSIAGTCSWMLTTATAGTVPNVYSGPLAANKINIESLQIVVPANVVGQVVFDDIQALTAGIAPNK